MSMLAAFLLMAGGLAVFQAAPPHLTHAQGLVIAEPTGVRTSGGRAEVVLAGGVLVHVDATTSIGYGPGGGLRLDEGRVIVRTSAMAIDIETPAATLRLLAGGVAMIMAERASGRLLVNVPAGEAILRTRYGAVTRVLSGQSAMMTGATAVPWATAYAPVQVDEFALWSDARVAAAGTATSADWVASGLAGAYQSSGSAPCTSWPSSSSPCWILPAGPGQSPHPPYPPGGPLPSPYAPNYAPNYAPHFNVTPPPVPAGTPPPPPSSTPPSPPHGTPPPPPPSTAPPPPPPPPPAAPPAVAPATAPKPVPGRRPPARPPPRPPAP